MKSTLISRRGATLAATALLALGAGYSGCESNDYTYRYDVYGCDTGNQSFSSKADYCAGLKNRAANHGCAVDKRKSAYEQDCGSDFQETGPQPAPAPTAAPVPMPSMQPLPQPQPEPEPEPADDRPQVVRDLETAGIKVDVYPVDNEPGEQPFRLRLEKFYDVLAAEETDLMSRKGNVSSILLTAYSSYAPIQKQLSLGVDLSAPELAEYLKIVDRRVQIEAETGVSLDLSVEIYGNEPGDKTRDIDAKVSYFEKNRDTLRGVRDMIREVWLSNDPSAYWTGDHRLKVEQDDYAGNLSRYLTALKPLNAFYAWANANKVEISGDFVDDTRLDGFASFVSGIASQRDSLNALVKWGGLTLISLQNDLDQSYYYDGEYNPASKDPGLSLNAKVLDALSTQYSTAASLGIKITAGVDLSLDAKYLAVIQRLQASLPTIRAKLADVKSIELSNASAYSAASKALIIGSSDSDADFAKVLASLP